MLSTHLVLLANYFKFQGPAISMLYKLLQNIKKRNLLKRCNSKTKFIPLPTKQSVK